MQTTLKDLTDLGLDNQKIIILINGDVGSVSYDNGQRNISGNTFNGNFTGNINTGDNTNQSTDQNQGMSEDVFKDLFEFIKHMPEGQEKSEALNDAEQLQEAIKNKNTERARKVYNLLADVVKTSSAGVAIAHAFGLI